MIARDGTPILTSAHVVVLIALATPTPHIVSVLVGCGIGGFVVGGGSAAGCAAVDELSAVAECGIAGYANARPADGRVVDWPDGPSVAG